uniref:ADAMTS/ADAMTS-like Spacer 1 domain-containing protein n=1 Tax=Laticauda laticaudata TaxID=8630 RepID=A0A8C5SK28_LATLA
EKPCFLKKWEKNLYIAGCDHMIGSSKKLDKCGVCGGDYVCSHCCLVEVNTHFSHLCRFGYNNVVTIPAGATNIDIKQHSRRGVKHDGNYLALQTLDGKYLLNGNFTVSAMEQDIFVKGTVLRYSGSLTTLERLQSYQQSNPHERSCMHPSVSKTAAVFGEGRSTKCYL